MNVNHNLWRMLKRHPRLAALATVAVVLCAAPVATARDSAAGGGAVVVEPANRVFGLSGGELLRESWAEVLAVPSVNPFTGHCLPLLGGKVLLPRPASGLAACTMTAGTLLFFRIGSFCSSPEARSSDEDVQRACALKFDRNLRAWTITVDGQTVNLLQPAFELISPQGTVTLPPDNFLGIPPQTVTFVAHGWGATVKLGPGQHTITGHVVSPGFDSTFTVSAEVFSRNA